MIKDVFINIGTLSHVVQCILIWLLIIWKKQSCMLKRRVGVQPRRSLNISRTPLPLPRAKIPWSMHVLYVENNVFESNLTKKIRVSTLVLRVIVAFHSFSRLQLLSTYRPPEPWMVHKMPRPYISPTKSIQLYIFHENQRQPSTCNFFSPIYVFCKMNIF